MFQDDFATRLGVSVFGRRIESVARDVAHSVEVEVLGGSVLFLGSVMPIASTCAGPEYYQSRQSPSTQFLGPK